MTKKKKRTVPLRLNILFFLIFLLFSGMILRLGIVQIVYGEDYRKEVERTEEVTISTSVPRGKIFDRNYNTIVDNKPIKAITYTRSASSDQEERLETAAKLAKIFDQDTTDSKEDQEALEEDLKKITVRDKKDYWILTRPEKAEKKITKADRQKVLDGVMSEDDLYDLQLERITENELKEITQEELKVLAIKREMDSGYALTPQIIKKDNISEKEFAFISENLDELPGIDITTDWERNYVFDKTLRTLIGSISSSEEGVPQDRLDYFTSREYSRNDRVGKSYLEYQYEDILQGQKAKARNITDKSGNIIDTEIITEGKSGKDLIMTVDVELQQEVEKIIEEELTAAKKKSGTALLDRAFVVMMDPRNGEVLSMAGKQIKKDESGKTVIDDYALGTMTSSYTMGSAVKGATVLSGFQSGVIKPGSIQLDEPLYIKGSPPKKSYQTMGNINDLEALQRSSNVYMFKTAIAMADGEYRRNKSLPLDTSAFSVLRNYYSQFGLGVKTGIDLPNEATGFKGRDVTPGLLLDLSIGQYDTYTPLQLAQYVSVIANGGYRMKPQLVKEIREPSPKDNLGSVIESINPEVLNKVEMKPQYVERVQEGFRRVMQEKRGTAYGYFMGADYLPAGKTGTAQAFYDGPNKDQFLSPTYNLTLVGYAPHNNPEIAFSVVVPWAYDKASNSHPINNLIGRRIMDKYFELKSEQSKEGIEEGVGQPENARELEEAE
ncbi:peptidoglycan D,D-transpeptidase FtsI family protein [Metabacillus indicus]|uniref:peptidoglycan D,D-transpeptidase FtsI family protein n=1 Tax=Metabacillus indicus TaxID=246786 RepID=UPI00248F6006|nr:penicillin-binding protein 2 [Metabacillus indicus]